MCTVKSIKQYKSINQLIDPRSEQHLESLGVCTYMTVSLLFLHIFTLSRQVQLYLKSTSSTSSSSTKFHQHDNLHTKSTSSTNTTSSTNMVPDGGTQCSHFCQLTCSSLVGIWIECWYHNLAKASVCHKSYTQYLSKVIMHCQE